MHYPLNIIDEGYKWKWLQIAVDYLSKALRPLVNRHLYNKHFVIYTKIEQTIVDEEELITLTLHRLPKHILLFVLTFIKPVW